MAESVSGQFLGEGTYSTVTKDTERNVAIKTFKEARDPNAIQEICILKYLQHDNIVHVNSIHLDANGMWKLYMRLYSFDLSKDWRSYITNIHPVAVLCKIMHDVSAGINYMHNNLVIHCDIKPHNILFDTNNMRAVITDLNLAVYNPQTMLSTRVQTSNYRAPEVDFSKKYGQFGYLIDIYSIGCVMYWLLTCERFVGIVDDDSTRGCCDALGLPMYSNRTERYFVLKSLMHHQLVTVLSERVNKTSWKTLCRVDMMSGAHCIRFIDKWFDIMAKCLLPDYSKRIDSQLLFGECRALTKYYEEVISNDGDRDEPSHRMLPMHLQTFGVVEVVKKMLDNIIVIDDKIKMNAAEVKSRLAWVRKMYHTCMREHSIWMQLIEINYYNKLGRKKILGSTEDILTISGCKWIVECISVRKHSIGVYHCDYMTCDDIEKKAIDILKTLNYDVIL